MATYADVTRLLLLFENLRLTLAKKRCEWECNKTIISETFCVFIFVKTYNYLIVGNLMSRLIYEINLILFRIIESVQNEHA